MCRKVLKSLDNLIHSRRELCESECLLHVRQSGGILAHRLILLDAAPLRIHCNLGTVEAAMEAGGNEAGYVANGTLGSLDQQINKLLLLCRINGEDVNKGNELLLFADRGHALIVEKLFP
jgi:hypothetical protein